ncbi:hypothetical protein DZF91_31005 [Actinomadura logoneensis]|uniref:Uncharacterized protein n=2 Tax=Actinomadura logoneensis TaxID=2293572 RepID=A0A372JEI8_9ACTN|nr:hypothetical protein DZF91_31005 [Actinomadura logoneensis]
MGVENGPTSNERWRFHCPRCVWTWEQVFEARQSGAHTAWYYDGLPSQPPWIDPGCPTCGAVAKAFPGGIGEATAQP